ncbi:hypothetical protein Droror1_Dr00023073 [Drosera rotundifolia]
MIAVITTIIHNKPTLITLLIVIFSMLSPPPFAGAQPPDTSSSPYVSNPGPYMGLIFLAFTAVAITTMLFYYFFRERCYRGTTSSPHTAGGGIFSVVNLPRGVDQSVLATFPVFTYSDVRAGKAGLDCAVCLSQFEGHERLRLLPICGHVFHIHCVDPWLGSHSTCPYCRADLVPRPGEPAHGPGHVGARDGRSVAAEAAPEGVVMVVVDEDARGGDRDRSLRPG